MILFRKSRFFRYWIAPQNEGEIRIRFAKDLDNILDVKLLAKIKAVVIECQAANNLTELKNIKKLQGYDTYYRIRLGDYRLGLEVVNDEIIFSRFLHRKDVYKYFP